MVQPEWWQVVRRRLLPNHRSRAPHRYFCQRTEWRTLYHSRNFSDNQTLRLCSVLWNSFCLFSSSCCCCCWCCCRCWKSDFRAENPHHIGGEWWVSPPSWWLGPTAACCTVTSCTVHHCTTVHQTCTVQHYTLHSISWSISNCQVNKYQINTTKIHPWSPSYKWQWQMAWLKTLVSFNWKHYILHESQSQLTY